MKVLKKIKARIGLSNKTALHCPPAQPLEFHPVHGDNVLLTQGNTIAARYSSPPLSPLPGRPGSLSPATAEWAGPAWLVREMAPSSRRSSDTVN
jgi:hypothetical protein